jgi:hypothetical protein
MPGYRLFIALATVATIVAFATGCGGGLETSCGAYLKEDERAQVDLAAQWGSPSRDGKVRATDRIVAPSYREKLISYCSQPDHADDKLKDLEFGFGFR